MKQAKGLVKVGQSRPILCPWYERKDPRGISNPPLMQAQCLRQKFPRILKLQKISRPYLLVLVAVAMLGCVRAEGQISKTNAPAVSASSLIPTVRSEIIAYNRTQYTLYFIS